MNERARAYLMLLLVYGVAVAVGAGVYVALSGVSELWRAAAADAAATLAVFAFSVGVRNSSMYDPYWSAAPPALFLLWSMTHEVSPRALLVGGLATLWGARLTWNFLRGFPHLRHEDWRYVDLRRQHGSRFWFVNLTGIHLMPTALTFAGSVPMLVVLQTPGAALNYLDAVAAAVTLLGITYEGVADQQLRSFVEGKPHPGSWLDRGLWRHSRHPNYFGETTFWWGLFLFALAADPASWWWAGLGAAAITLLFVFISIPMLDRRMVARRPGYEDHMRRVSRLVPWPVKDAPNDATS